jgi:hypothetical protein
LDNNYLYVASHRQYGGDHYVVVWAEVVDALCWVDDEIFSARERLGGLVFHARPGDWLPASTSLIDFVLLVPGNCF